MKWDEINEMKCDELKRIVNGSVHQIAFQEGTHGRM